MLMLGMNVSCVIIYHNQKMAVHRSQENVPNPSVCYAEIAAHTALALSLTPQISVKNRLTNMAGMDVYWIGDCVPIRAGYFRQSIQDSRQQKNRAVVIKVIAWQ